jgi:hypothetical protein
MEVENRLKESENRHRDELREFEKRQKDTSG